MTLHKKSQRAQWHCNTFDTKSDLDKEDYKVII